MDWIVLIFFKVGWLWQPSWIVFTLKVNQLQMCDHPSDTQTHSHTQFPCHPVTHSAQPSTLTSTLWPLYFLFSVPLHFGHIPISAPVIASSKILQQKSQEALFVLLCFDDTDCSQMRQRHIHSANGDKAVLLEARGQGEGKKRDGMAQMVARSVKRKLTKYKEQKLREDVMRHSGGLSHHCAFFQKRIK